MRGSSSRGLLRRIHWKGSLSLEPQRKWYQGNLVAPTTLAQKKLIYESFLTNKYFAHPTFPQGRTNPAFSKPCLCLSDTRHFRRFRGSEERSPCFQQVECKFATFTIFSSKQPFLTGDKNTVYQKHGSCHPDFPCVLTERLSIRELRTQSRNDQAQRESLRVEAPYGFLILRHESGPKF